MLEIDIMYSFRENKVFAESLPASLPYHPSPISCGIACAMSDSLVVTLQLDHCQSRCYYKLKLVAVIRFIS